MNLPSLTVVTLAYLQLCLGAPYLGHEKIKDGISMYESQDGIRSNYDMEQYQLIEHANHKIKIYSPKEPVVHQEESLHELENNDNEMDPKFVHDVQQLSDNVKATTDQHENTLPTRVRLVYVMKDGIPVKSDVVMNDISSKTKLLAYNTNIPADETNHGLKNTETDKNTPSNNKLTYEKQLNKGNYNTDLPIQEPNTNTTMETDLLPVETESEVVIENLPTEESVTIANEDIPLREVDEMQQPMKSESKLPEDNVDVDNQATDESVPMASEDIPLREVDEMQQPIKSESKLPEDNVDVDNQAADESVPLVKENIPLRDVDDEVQPPIKSESKPLKDNVDVGNQATDESVPVVSENIPMHEADKVSHPMKSVSKLPQDNVDVDNQGTDESVPIVSDNVPLRDVDDEVPHPMKSESKLPEDNIDVDNQAADESVPMASEDIPLHDVDEMQQLMKSERKLPEDNVDVDNEATDASVPIVKENIPLHDVDDEVQQPIKSESKPPKDNVDVNNQATDESVPIASEDIPLRDVDEMQQPMKSESKLPEDNVDVDNQATEESVPIASEDIPLHEADKVPHPMKSESKLPEDNIDVDNQAADESVPMASEDIPLRDVDDEVQPPIKSESKPPKDNVDVNNQATDESVPIASEDIPLRDVDEMQQPMKSESKLPEDNVDVDNQATDESVPMASEDIPLRDVDEVQQPMKSESKLSEDNVDIDNQATDESVPIASEDIPLREADEVQQPMKSESKPPKGNVDVGNQATDESVPVVSENIPMRDVDNEVQQPIKSESKPPKDNVDVDNQATDESVPIASEDIPLRDADETQQPMKPESKLPEDNVDVDNQATDESIPIVSENIPLHDVDDEMQQPMKSESKPLKDNVDVDNQATDESVPMTSEDIPLRDVDEMQQPMKSESKLPEDNVDVDNQATDESVPIVSENIPLRDVDDEVQQPIKSESKPPKDNVDVDNQASDESVPIVSENIPLRYVDDEVQQPIKSESKPPKDNVDVDNQATDESVPIVSENIPLRDVDDEVQQPIKSESKPPKDNVDVDNQATDESVPMASEDVPLRDVDEMQQPMKSESKPPKDNVDVGNQVTDESDTEINQASNIKKPTINNVETETVISTSDEESSLIYDNNSYEDVEKYSDFKTQAVNSEIFHDEALDTKTFDNENPVETDNNNLTPNTGSHPIFDNEKPVETESNNMTPDTDSQPEADITDLDPDDEFSIFDSESPKFSQVDTGESLIIEENNLRRVENEPGYITDIEVDNIHLDSFSAKSPDFEKGVDSNSEDPPTKEIQPTKSENAILSGNLNDTLPTSDNINTESPNMEETIINERETTGELFNKNINPEANQDIKRNLEKQTHGAAFMAEYNRMVAESKQKMTLASWNYATNITEHNKLLMIKEKEILAKSIKKFNRDLQIWKDDWPNFPDESLKRQFKLYSHLGSSILPEDKFLKLAQMKTEMSTIYSTAQICDFKNSSKCDLSLDPELAQIMSKSRDYDELVHVWTAWRNSSGKRMKALFQETVKLQNEAAVMNGFKNLAEEWKESYENQNLEKENLLLLEKLQPLYRQLHAYTRRKLREVYGKDKVSQKGPIPAHLLGNMWSQDWSNIYDILIPYPERKSVDVTDAMIKQNFTAKIMFQKADDFFASLGMERVSESFWNKSVITKPSDRKIACHPNAWDFSDGKDFRIKQCTKLTMEDFYTVHHELGHIQYFLQYKDLPAVFRSGANPGFHEAVGDVLTLSVSTPKHLNKVGLLESTNDDHQLDINFLLSSALSSVAFIPFGFLIDKWRWDAFRGFVTPDNYTCSWWDYRYEMQGIKAPVQRTEFDFDPAAKYHVASGVEYIRYFVSRILTFQFHQSFCLLADEYESGNPNKPLHKCDIYESKEAGEAMSELMKVGRSQHWRKTLEKLTGTQEMSIEPLLEYFKPLQDWLTADNLQHDEFIGWEGENDFCTNS